MTPVAATLAERLAEWWAAQHGDHRSVAVELLAAPASGNSNTTVPLAITWEETGADQRLELVLRMQTSDNQIFLDADSLREHQVVAGLADSPGIPVPRVLDAEQDPSWVGAPFFLMERVHGTVPHGMPSIHVDGWVTTRSPEVRSTICREAMSALAALHRVDWTRSHAFLADAAQGTGLQQRLDHLTKWYRWSTNGRSFPTTDAALDHLRSHMPTVRHPPALLWGDPRIGNMMYRDDGTLAAVLDWELASVGPPELDLAWWLMFEEFQSSGHGIDPLPGWYSADQFVDAYTEASGHELGDLDWYQVLSVWALAVTVIRMTDFGVAKGTVPPTTRMAEGNIPTQMLARRLGLPIPELDPDYAKRRKL